MNELGGHASPSDSAGATGHRPARGKPDTFMEPCGEGTVGSTCPPQVCSLSKEMGARPLQL